MNPWKRKKEPPDLLSVLLNFVSDQSSSESSLPSSNCFCRPSLGRAFCQILGHVHRSSAYLVSPAQIVAESLALPGCRSGCCIPSSLLGSLFAGCPPSSLLEILFLLALISRSVCYAIGSPDLNSPSRFGCLWGQLRRFVSSSAFAASGYHTWPNNSVWIEPCRLIGLNQSQVSYSLPILFLLVRMVSFWPLPLNALQDIRPQSCDCWPRVPRLTWIWGRLRLNWLVGVIVLCYPFCLAITNLLPCPTRRLCSLVTAQIIFFDYLCWILVTLVHSNLRLLFVMISFALIRVFFLLLPTLIEGALKYPPLFKLIFFCHWSVCNCNVDLWAYWLLLDCFHLNQCVYVPGMIELPCSVFWNSLARLELCLAFDCPGMRARAMLSCYSHSILITMVRFWYTQKHACLVRLATGINLVNLKSNITSALVKPTLSCGWLLAYMMRLLCSSTATWVAVFECWGFPLSWLFLPLERLFALRQDPLWYCFCWHLHTFQIGRDEVTGKNLFVNEELLSETAFVNLFEVSRGVCRVVWVFFGAGPWPWWFDQIGC